MEMVSSVGVSLSSSSSSSKRTRGMSNGDGVASCLVEGCASDLRKCSEYHRRHKVCEVHSKTAIVMVEGREQRFCQQCSRFHLLVEFDAVKRSCRKRLEGHNKRRRKPQLHSLNSGFMTNYQGMSQPQIFSITTEKPNWSPIIKAEEIPLDTPRSLWHLTNGQHEYEHFPLSTHGIFKQAKKFPLSQENVQADPAPALQPLLKTTSTAGLRNSRRKHSNFTSALSLLSSPESWLSGDRIPVGQPLIPAMQSGGLSPVYGSQPLNSVSPTGFLYTGVDSQNVGTVLISDSSDDFQCNGSFGIGSQVSSIGNHQTISFSWQ